MKRISTVNLDELMKWNEEKGADHPGRGSRSFSHAFLPEETGESEALWERAREAGVPVIRAEMKSLLRVLLLAKRPVRILEIGTAVGYSALFMRECMQLRGFSGEIKPDSFLIDTIEKDETRYVEALENFRKAGAEEIHAHLGDAAEVIGELPGPYDFVFMDAAKAQYGVYLDKLMDRLMPGAMIVTDNILQEGAMTESRYISDKRDRTIHDRLREYLFRINHTPFQTTLLDTGDGVAVSIYSVSGENSL